MKMKVLISTLIALILIIPFYQILGHANNVIQTVTIITPTAGMTVKQICDEINKQLGKDYAKVHKYYINHTVEIEIKNMQYGDALIKLAKILNSKYGDCSVSKEGDKYIIRKSQPLVDKNEAFYSHHLKHVSYEYLKNLINIKIPDSNKKIRTIYYQVNNSIWINCNDDSLKPLIYKIVESYDVELFNTNENILKSIQKQY